MLRKLEKQFSFAGFDFPRYVGSLPKGTLAARLAEFKKRGPKHTGPYYTAPKPNESGVFFYLLQDGMEGAVDLRWVWCDEVKGVRIDHTGWYCDEFQDGKMRGMVIKLPHGRCIIGWSMGYNMASVAETDTVYWGSYMAAYEADRLAERAAEKEREYQAQETARVEQEEAEAEAVEAAYWAERDTVTV